MLAYQLDLSVEKEKVAREQIEDLKAVLEGNRATSGSH
jgi:hypothetical protein